MNENGAFKIKAIILLLSLSVYSGCMFNSLHSLSYASLIEECKAENVLACTIYSDSVVVEMVSAPKGSTTKDVTYRVMLSSDQDGQQFIEILSELEIPFIYAEG